DESRHARCARSDGGEGVWYAGCAGNCCGQHRLHDSVARWKLCNRARIAVHGRQEARRCGCLLRQGDLSSPHRKSTWYTDVSLLSISLVMGIQRFNCMVMRASSASSPMAVKPKR